MFKAFYHHNKIRNRWRLTILLISSLLLSQLAPLFAPTELYAADEPAFVITTDYKIYYNPGSDFVTIEEKVSFLANNKAYYSPAKGVRTFLLPDFTSEADPEDRKLVLESVRIMDKYKTELQLTTEEVEGGIEISVPEKRNVTYLNSEVYIITYNTRKLIDPVGNIVNIYIPGLPKELTFTTKDEKYGLTTQYNFSTELILPKESKAESFIMPTEGITIREEQEQRIYAIDTNARLGQTIWIQLGDVQYYYFKIKQETKKTDRIIPGSISRYSPLLSTNIYEIPLPREHQENWQTVYFTKLQPQPTSLRRDDEGNLIATFEVPANRTDQIIIEGYIQVRHDETQPKDLPLDSYRETVQGDPNLQKYLLADTFWESEDPVITDVSTPLEAKSRNILELINANYDFVIDSFDYSYEKVEGDNTRVGAAAALQGAQAVCMEYSDTLIAILRAQGIPARAAIGYGNDPTGAENSVNVKEATRQNIGHQWVQVWIPDYGWLSVDPTWGESGRRYIGGNLDHVLWYTVGDSDQGFIGTSLSSADLIASQRLSGYEVYLKATAEEEFLLAGEMLPLEELVSKYEDVEIDPISTFLKTTTLGKVIIVTSPAIALFFSILVITTLFNGVRRLTRLEKPLA